MRTAPIAVVQVDLQRHHYAACQTRPHACVVVTHTSIPTAPATRACLAACFATHLHRHPVCHHHAHQGPAAARQPLQPSHSAQAAPAALLGGSQLPAAAAAAAAAAIAGFKAADEHLQGS
jgi:hypothetical protein